MKEPIVPLLSNSLSYPMPVIVVLGGLNLHF
jgi:hypothetical protein